MKKTAAFLAVAALALGATACSDDTETAETEETTTTAAAGEGVQVTGQWARTSPMSTGNGAAYMNLVAAEDDALVGASVGASVAATVEVHETVAADDASMGDDMEMGDDMASTTMGDMGGDASMDDSMSTTTMAGMGAMTMREVEKIELPAGEKVQLKPGGYHIMLIDLAGALEEGGEIEITLDFEKAADMVVKVPILAEAPA